jgi:ribonuclease H2 subunit A
LFKIVGAASIIAKVTRDRYIHSWVDPEDHYAKASGSTLSLAQTGTERVRHISQKEGEEAGLDIEVEDAVVRGSGYPSDPKTQAYLKEGMDPVFGYKGIVRFSWATVKVLLDKNGVECKW